MDAARNQPAQAKGGKLVTPASTGEQALGESTPARADGVACVSVREGYERWAQSYDHSCNPILALEERYVSRIVPDLVEKNALDLACGTGRWLTRLLARSARIVVGLDLSAAMLRVAGKKTLIRGRLVQADSLQLPFRSFAFDFVLCSFALNHIHSLDVLAEEIGRTMKLGGELLICEMHPEAYARGWRPGFRDIESAAHIETVGHSAEDVISSFRSNGFTCLNLHELVFGEPERPIFLNSGKGEMFTDACRGPAIQIYQFMNTDFATRS
jgi:ubiquinone/menaquinone biosynthesis C-methylase UbiE